MRNQGTPIYRFYTYQVHWRDNPKSVKAGVKLLQAKTFLMVENFDIQLNSQFSLESKKIIGSFLTFKRGVDLFPFEMLPSGEKDFQIRNSLVNLGY